MKYCYECAAELIDFNAHAVEAWTTWKCCTKCVLVFRVKHQDRMSGTFVDPIIEVYFGRDAFEYKKLKG